MKKVSEDLAPSINIRVCAYDRGELVEVRASHNVWLNAGRSWMRGIVGAANYGLTPPTPHNTHKVAYVGLGCGGALQTGTAFSRSQPEVVTVTALEDPIAVSGAGDDRVWLKQVLNQTAGTTFFPGDFRTEFIVDFVETEVSYAGNETYTSEETVATNVPVSEVGLYLSDAEAGIDIPTGANSMVAYNIFSPIPVTPSTVLRVSWQLRF